MSFQIKKKEGVIKTFCRMCSYHCGIDVHLENGSVMKINGTSESPLSEGSLCIKGRVINELISSPHRLLKPLKRTGSKWEEVNLDEALDDIAGKVMAIKGRFGPESMAVWKGEALGSGQQRDLAHRFAQALGTSNVFSNDTLCAVSKKAAVKSVLGAYPLPDIAQAKSIIIWGANPLASHFPLARKIIQARKKGLQVILIDPRKSTFARHADLYIPIKPAADGALALGVINRLIENRWYDQKFVAEQTLGFSELADYAARFTPSDVEQETGVSRDHIDLLTRAIAESAPASAFMVGVGPEHHDNGFNSIRAIAAIFALCGCIDRRGGNLLPDRVPLNSAGPDRQAALSTKPIGSDTYPVFYDNHQEGHTCMAMDAILAGKPQPLRGMVMTGANPVLTNPNTKKVVKALSGLDLFVVRDLFMTETAKLADYVLPAASFLERSEVISTGLPHSIALTQQVMAIENCQSEFSFFRDLAGRLGAEEYFPWQDEAELNNWILEPLGLSSSELASMPQGYIYKPYRYEKFFGDRFKTPSGKIEFTSKYLAGHGYKELPIYERAAYRKNEENLKEQFILITGARQARFNHSCYHNIPKFKNAVPRPLLEIHPEDAFDLSIADGETVEVVSEIGSLEIQVSITAPGAIMKGILQIPHGFDNGNVSTIIPDYTRDPVSGFPALKSVPVTIRKQLIAL